MTCGLALLQFGQDLAHAEALHTHAGHADDVGSGQAIVIDGLGVFVEEGDVVPGWRQGCRRGRQATGRLARLPSNGKACSRPQLGNAEARVDEDDVGHDEEAPEARGPASAADRTCGRSRPAEAGG
jgi:hypothetical protein